jgi:hypothetical protein
MNPKDINLKELAKKIELFLIKELNSEDRIKFVLCLTLPPNYNIANYTSNMGKTNVLNMMNATRKQLHKELNFS